MHQNSSFSDKNLKKKFWEWGTAPSPDLSQTPQWGGDTPSPPYTPSTSGRLRPLDPLRSFVPEPHWGTSDPPAPL